VSVIRYHQAVAANSTVTSDATNGTKFSKQQQFKITLKTNKSEQNIPNNCSKAIGDNAPTNTPIGAAKCRA
jgi:hypothetical protein